MRAMVLEKSPGELQLKEVPTPRPDPDQVLIRIKACGVCRTDLHLLDGELPFPKLPLIPGHEIVGEIVERGGNVRRFSLGDRVGVPWLGSTCGHCVYCRRGQENLCTQAEFTGYQIPGGYAEFTVAKADYCIPLPKGYSDTTLAPLLCAGLIGYRSYKKIGGAKRLGLYGFGAAAHILIQIAIFQGKQVYAFTRSGDQTTQTFAKSLGAVWAGDSDQFPPEKLDAAIIFAPVGALVPQALRTVGPGGRVICGGIHMSEIPAFPYEILWQEKSVGSVANLTRQDGLEFFQLTEEIPLRTETQTYPLEGANQALQDLKNGKLTGAAVLVTS